MCYSAQIIADFKIYKRYGGELGIKEFFNLFWRRAREAFPAKVPKAIEAQFANPTTDAEREIKDLIDEYHRAAALEIEQEIFEQRKRLADAERKLAEKVTKTASESKRIANDKIAKAKVKLADFSRTELKDRDSRIFPYVYAPVMVVDDGRQVVYPMRYLCRPAGRPASFDTQYPGIFNARRDSLEKFWKAQFGYTHGVVLLSAFYENVPTHRAEGRELRPDESVTNTILEFRPNTHATMLAACLWSRWSAPGQPDLLSMALITDEPPDEVAAAGHDRCLIPLKLENVDAWLRPDAKNLAAIYEILDDREQPYFEHRIDKAAA